MLPRTLQATKMFIVQSQSNKASRQVLNFFLFQTGMVLLESLYALTTPSAGLILVSADNIFCCVGLALGLYTIRQTAAGRRAGEDVSRWKSVAGFANGILLVYVAVLVVLEAVERHIERGSVEYAHTFTVCVLGTLGNVTGLVFFPRSARRHDHNVQGIYLHIWGNTLAFIGVALCAGTAELAQDTLVLGVAGALAVAAIIVALAVPLLSRSARVLCAPTVRTLPSIASTLRTIPGVMDVESVRMWTLPSGGSAVAVRVHATHGVSDEVVIRATRDALASAGAKRARTIVEVLRSTHQRAPSFSARLNVLELERGSVHAHVSTHRRSQSSSRLELL